MKVILKDIVIALIITCFICCCIKPTIVKGTSMENTFHENDYLFVNKISCKLNEPEYGDIVIVKSEIEGEKYLIKRLIGKPGDEIEINKDKLFINDKLQDEPYVNKDNYDDTTGKWRVPDDSYFVLGDNRRVSLDSRYEKVGYVAKNKIMGKVMIRLYPFNKITTY